MGNKHVFWNGEIKAAGLANRVVWNEVCVVNVGTLRPVDAMSNSPYKVPSLLLTANRSALNTACSNGNFAELGGQDMVSSTRVAKSKSKCAGVMAGNNNRDEKVAFRDKFLKKGGWCEQIWQTVSKNEKMGCEISNGN